MNPTTRAYLQIHTAVLLFGFTGILGHEIDLPKGTLVWWRMMLTAFSLLLVPGMLSAFRTIPRRARWELFGIGSIVAFHWVFFFLGIQLTNVSVALACMASASFFTALLEPLLLKTKMVWYEVVLGVLVVPGVMLVYRSSEFEIIGILVTLLSALLAVIFSILNKKMVAKYNTITITFVELGSGWIVLSVLLPFYYWWKPGEAFVPTEGIDWVYLLILAFVCTSFAYVINLKALKELSPFAVNLTINLEPVYAIILADVLLAEHEELAWTFYPGAGMIIFAVFSYPLIRRLRRRRGLT